MTAGPRTLDWHILTGEFPPRHGGVGDYTAILAAGLAAGGAGVHVWTTEAGSAPRPEIQTPGIEVHRIGREWDGDGLARLARGLDAFETPRRLLVQYAPNVWGRKGLNFGFCRWLVRRRHESGDEIRVMFHEVAYPWLFPDRPTRWSLAAGHRLMARDLLKAATRVDVSTLAWVPMLRRLAPGGRVDAHWQPVPSNITYEDDSAAVAAVRRRVAPRGEAVVGCFRAFTGVVAPRLEAVLTRLLGGRSDRVALMIGRESEAFVARLRSKRPDLAGLLVATGGLTPSMTSAHLAACDLVVQLYPDGVTTRRGTLMAALAHGVAAVTHAGVHTEPVWGESGALVVARDENGVVPAAEALLADGGERGRLGEAGRALYECRFALHKTVESLLLPDVEGGRGG